MAQRVLDPGYRGEIDVVCSRCEGSPLLAVGEKQLWGARGYEEMRMHVLLPVGRVKHVPVFVSGLGHLSSLGSPDGQIVTRGRQQFRNVNPSTTSIRLPCAKCNARPEFASVWIVELMDQLMQLGVRRVAMDPFGIPRWVVSKDGTRVRARR